MTHEWIIEVCIGIITNVILWMPKVKYQKKTKIKNTTSMGIYSTTISPNEFDHDS